MRSCRKTDLFIVIEVIHPRREVLEMGVFANERQTHKANCSVTLFTDDDFRHALVLGFGVLHFVALSAVATN